MHMHISVEREYICASMSCTLVLVSASVCYQNLEQWPSQSSVVKETEKLNEHNIVLIVELLLLLVRTLNAA